jgi:signal peptidase II
MSEPDRNDDVPGSADAGASSSTGGGGGSSPARPSANANVTIAQWVFLVLVAVTTAGLDLWTKGWATRHLSEPNPHPPAVCSVNSSTGRWPGQNFPAHTTVWIDHYLNLQYAENCGGAWGLLHGTRESLRKPFFLLVTVGAVLFILHLYRSLEQGQRAMRVALPLVLGGAIGNLVDRIRLGYVVDFIHAHWREKYHWPTFNVADIAITVGIGLMLLEYVLGPRKPPVRKAANPAASQG